jgi:hypothetical protein
MVIFQSSTRHHPIKNTSGHLGKRLKSGKLPRSQVRVCEEIGDGQDGRNHATGSDFFKEVLEVASMFGLLFQG